MHAIAQSARKNWGIVCSQILAYIIITGTLQLSVCKEDYTNRTYFQFKCSSCNKFSTDLFWLASLLGSEHFSKCSSTKIAFYDETFVKVTCNHVLSIIIQWIFLYGHKMLLIWTMFWLRISGENEWIQQLQGSYKLVYGIMWSFLIQTAEKIITWCRLFSQYFV